MSWYTSFFNVLDNFSKLRIDIKYGYWREILKLLEEFEIILLGASALALPLLAVLALAGKARKYTVKHYWETYRIEFLKIPVAEKEKLAEISNRIKSFLAEVSRTNCILGLHLSFNKNHSRFYLLISGREDCLEKGLESLYRLSPRMRHPEN